MKPKVANQCEISRGIFDNFIPQNELLIYLKEIFLLLIG